jgi:hypothetical protein
VALAGLVLAAVVLGSGCSEPAPPPSLRSFTMAGYTVPAGFEWAELAEAQKIAGPKTVLDSNPGYATPGRQIASHFEAILVAKGDGQGAIASMAIEYEASVPDSQVERDALDSCEAASAYPEQGLVGHVLRKGQVIASVVASTEEGTVAAVDAYWAKMEARTGGTTYC